MDRDWLNKVKIKAKNKANLLSISMLNLDIDGEIWRKSRSILLDMDANGGYIWKLIRLEIRWMLLKNHRHGICTGFHV